MAESAESAEPAESADAHPPPCVCGGRRWGAQAGGERPVQLEGCSCFGPHCLSRYVPVRSPKSRKRRRVSQQLAWWCAASSVVSQSARVVGGLLSRLCRLRPLCRPPLARACHQSPKPAVYCQTGGARAWPVVGSLSAALMVRAIARSSRARTPPSTVAMRCAVTMVAIGCSQQPG